MSEYAQDIKLKFYADLNGVYKNKLFTFKIESNKYFFVEYSQKYINSAKRCLYHFMNHGNIIRSAFLNIDDKNFRVYDIKEDKIYLLDYTYNNAKMILDIYRLLRDNKYTIQTQEQFNFLQLNNKI